MRLCSVPECEVVHYARGYCKSHYDRWRRRGVVAASTVLSVEERFWSKVDKTAGCWVWTAGRVGGGYGTFTVDRRAQVAHRFAYELLVGPVPDGLQLDHLCRNRQCVNPAHLEPVTARTNLLRGEGVAAKNARKTHCNRGHAYTAETTYVYKDTGHRLCKVCQRQWQRENRKAGR